MALIFPCAANLSPQIDPEDEIARRLDVDSLHYLSMPGLLRSVMHSDSGARHVLTAIIRCPAANARKWDWKETTGKKPETGQVPDHKGGCG